MFFSRKDYFHRAKSKKCKDENQSLIDSIKLQDKCVSGYLNKKHFLYWNCHSGLGSCSVKKIKAVRSSGSFYNNKLGYK